MVRRHCDRDQGPALLGEGGGQVMRPMECICSWCAAHCLISCSLAVLLMTHTIRRPLIVSVPFTDRMQRAASLRSPTDLQNEPHASSWGKGEGRTKDWGHAAERIGNHVLALCPRWLIMVEGVGYSPGALGLDDGSAGIWWVRRLHAFATPTGALHTRRLCCPDACTCCPSPHTHFHQMNTWLVSALLVGGVKTCEVPLLNLSV